MCAIKIGWAKRDISTTEPVNINGQMYLRISEGIHDPIMVTALCVDGGEGQDAVFFVSCDVTSITMPVVNAVKEKMAKYPHIPGKNIVLNATHTHSSSATFDTAEKSPDGRDIYPGAKYREFFTNMIVEVGHSRRVIYSVDQGKANPLSAAPNGFGTMYGNTNKPDFSHYEAGADHFLNVMFTTDPEGKLTGMVVNVPCPSQISEHFTKLSADYWNEVREGVAAEFGPEVFVLGQCAAAGDLSPRTLHYKQAQARRMEIKYGLPYDPTGSMAQYNKVMGERKDIAERILAGVKDVWSWAKKDIQTEVVVRHSVEDVYLTRRMITDEEKQWCEDNIKQMESLVPDPATCTPEEYRVARSRFESYRNRNMGAIRRYDEQVKKPKIDYTIHVTKIGEIGFASNPFELYMDFMHRIQARSPFIQTFITQLAGDGGGGYLPTTRGEFNKGYSASIFCNQVGAQGGQELVEYTLAKLTELKEKDEV